MNGCGPQLTNDAEAVSRYIGMSEGLYLEWFGDHNSLDVGRQHAGDRHAVSHCFNDRFFRLQMLPAEPLQGHSGHVDPALISSQTVLPDQCTLGDPCTACQ